MQNSKSIVWTAVLSVVAAGALAGCQRQVNVPQGRLEVTELDPDEAMDLRDWNRMSAYYTNPRFIAGPTGFWFRTPEEQTEFQHLYALTETPMFVGQTLFLPVALVITPPLTPVEYAGEKLPPTYHAMPPLPPSPRARVTPPVMERDAAPRVMPPAPYDPAPGEAVIPGTQPTRGLEGGMPTRPPADRSAPATAPGAMPRPSAAPAPARPAPRAAPATTPALRITPAPAPRAAPPATAPAATQPVYVPSVVAPRRDGPATAPARPDMNM